MMRIWMVRGLLLSSVLGLLTASVTDAAGPGGITSLNTSGTQVTVTTTTLTAPLFLFDSSTPAGTLCYTTITVTKTGRLGTSTTTCRLLTGYVYGLPVPDGTIVTLDDEVEGENHFGSAKVCHGKAFFLLNSCNGDYIPDIQPGDEIEVESIDTDDDLASGFAGAPVVRVTH